MSQSISQRATFKGFTIIELAIVITILGVLAAIAIPRFFNISGDAQTAATKGVATALASASATNYALRSDKPNTGSAITNCTDVSSLLLGGLPTGYKITSLIISTGTTVTCTLNGPSSTIATFSATGIN